VLARLTSILPAQNDEKKPRKLPCRRPRPPPNRITSRRIPARSSSSRMPFPSGPPSRMRQTKSAGSSSLSPPEPSSQPFSRRRGRLLSTEFMRLPSKRQYADYYQQIQNPIALDEIKSRIETGKYPNLEAVRQDLELCFKNAKKYNIRDSPIWKDAKHLHVCCRFQSAIYATRLTSARNLSTRNTPG